jgi:hypothetical protein
MKSTSGQGKKRRNESPSDEDSSEIETTKKNNNGRKKRIIEPLSDSSNSSSSESDNESPKKIKGKVPKKKETVKPSKEEEGEAEDKFPAHSSVIVESVLNPKRLFKSQVPNKTKSPLVIYWMSRDQRANDNWALIHSSSNPP